MSRVSMLEELPGMELLLEVVVGARDTRRFFAGVDDDDDDNDAA